MSDEERDAVRSVRRKSELLVRARRVRGGLWRTLATVGVLGWMFVLPVVVFTALGHWLDVQLGRHSLAIAGMLLGLAAGAYATARAILRASRHDDDDVDRPPPPRGPASEAKR